MLSFELVLRVLFNGWAGPTDVVTQERFQEAKEKLFAADVSISIFDA